MSKKARLVISNISPIKAARIGTYDDNISSTTTTGVVGELPEDLWIQVFIRLSVKPLLLVTSVCKRWHNLIKDPSFIRKHLQFQKMKSKDSGDFLLHHQDMVARDFNYLLFDGESVGKLSGPYHTLLQFFRWSVIVPLEIDGPINGLYCLHNMQGAMVIWNPSTKEVGLLPDPNQCLPPGGFNKSKRLAGGPIGFGVDPLDEENYKVILISYAFTSPEKLIDIYGMLYTTKTNTWTLLNDDLIESHSFKNSLNNTFLNGFYYWMGKRNYTALVFDMRKEDFREISIPCNHGNLALHNDHITLFSVNKNLNEIDVWVMLGENNWLKKISVRGIEVHAMIPLGFWKTENEMLLEIGDPKESRWDHEYISQTVLYNTTTREIRNLGPRGYSYGFKALSYCESLVSLSGGITKHKEDGRGSLLNTVYNYFSTRFYL